MSFLRMHSCSKIVLLVLLCSYLGLCYAVPTFGNEYVHIKVHVPKEISHKHVYHTAAHEPDFHPPANKVIHHYHHRRRRPTKKDHRHNEHDALLGSLVLSEVKTPITDEHLEYLQHVDDIANSLAKPNIKEAPTKEINTYTVIEETQPLTKAHSFDGHSRYHWKKPAVETIKIIDTKAPPTHVDTYRIIEFKEPAPHRAHKTHTETIKYIEDVYPQKSHAETVKVIDSYTPSTQFEYEEHTGGAGYQFARKPHTETVKIVEAKVPSGHAYRGHNHITAPHAESIEVTETKVTTPTRFYHRRPYGGSASEYDTASRPDYTYDDSDSNRYVEYYRPPAGSYLPPKNTYLSPKDSYAPPSDAYLPPRDTYLLSADSYLPSKRPADFHQIRQNSVYEDDYRSSDGAAADVAASVGKQYLPATVSDDAEAYDYSHSAVDTYSGIDSYAAEHVQGVGSGGYPYT